MATPRRPRRRDIEGLRAVAIAAVVVYHARPSLLPGGYVGVDVFFVISGYLVTGMLWRELEERRRVSLTGFYAARARRLLPASTLVVVATMTAGAVLWPPLQVTALAKDAIASALYVNNYRLALLGTNYLTASGPVSPFQHYWSLGVEEQFYLVWPLLLVAAAACWRRRDAPPSRQGACAALVVLAAASFALAWHLTTANPPWAFYSLPTRAYELAAGGIVALLEPWIAGIVPEAATLAGWTGLALIVASVERFGATTPFPGTAALAPVCGAAGVLVAGCAKQRYGPSLILDRAPMQWLGAASYCLYLWHFPVLVLAPYLTGHPLTPIGSLLAVCCAVALAAATVVLVERPVRFSRWLSGHPGWSLTSGVSWSLGAAAVAVVVATSMPTLHGSGTVRSVTLAVNHAPARRPETAEQRLAAQAAALDATVQATVAASARLQTVPADVAPSLADASTDEPPPMYDGCFDSFLDTVAHPCIYGDTSATKSIVLFGDSHAVMWYPALETIAVQHHLQLVVQGKATCPPLDLEVFSPDLGEWYTQCDAWREAVVERIEALRPELVVLGFSREYGVGNDDVQVYGSAWMHGLAEMIHAIEATGAEVVVVGPVPYPPFLVPDCLAGHLDDPTQCSMPDKAPWYDVAGVAAEEAVVHAAGAGYIDVQRWFCTSTTCLTLIGNKVAYRDDNHISATYAAWLEPAFAAELALDTNGRF